MTMIGVDTDRAVTVDRPPRGGGSLKMLKPGQEADSLRWMLTEPVIGHFSPAHACARKTGRESRADFASDVSSNRRHLFDVESLEMTGEVK